MLIAVIVVLVCLLVLGLVPFYILRRLRAKEKLRTEHRIDEPPISAVVPEEVVVQKLEQSGSQEELDFERRGEKTNTSSFHLPKIKNNRGILSNKKF